MNAKYQFAMSRPLNVIHQDTDRSGIIMSHNIYFNNTGDKPEFYWQTPILTEAQCLSVNGRYVPTEHGCWLVSLADFQTLSNKENFTINSEPLFVDADGGQFHWAGDSAIVKDVDGDFSLKPDSPASILVSQLQ